MLTATEVTSYCPGHESKPRRGKSVANACQMCLVDQLHRFGPNPTIGFHETLGARMIKMVERLRKGQIYEESRDFRLVREVFPALTTNIVNPAANKAAIELDDMALALKKRTDAQMGRCFVVALDSLDGDWVGHYQHGLNENEVLVLFAVFAFNRLTGIPGCRLWTAEEFLIKHRKLSGPGRFINPFFFNQDGDPIPSIFQPC